MSQIQLLKNDSVIADKKLSDLLRRAKMVATELNSKNFLEWVEKELNGYGKDDGIPDYRMIVGEPKALNPYRGWIPWVINNPDSQEKISRRGVIQSIGELEQLVKSEKDSLHMPYPENLQKTASSSVGFQTRFTLVISRISIIRILEFVRNKLIDWLIEIDQEQEKIENNKPESKIIFPDELIKKLPKDLKILADDFNFNFGSGRSVTGMLILRRMLPLSIVRKFQKLNREQEIKDINGNYFDTKVLLGKSESLLSDKRVYNELANYKILIDSSQHSYVLNVQMPDTEGAAIKLRIFIENIF